MRPTDGTYRDSALRRTALGSLERAGRLLGHERARFVAARWWSARRPVSDEEFFKLAHRISPRVRNENPHLFKVPRSWTAESSIVRTKCLGLDLELDLRDNLQALLFFGGTYEPRVVEFLDEELRQGDVFIDVGAHIGWHSLVAAQRLTELGGGAVVAFEPTTDSADKIRVAAARNRLSVEVVQVALGEDDGETALFSDPNYDEHDAGVRSQYGKGRLVERVAVVSFDHWVAQRGLPRMDLVKMDVEGAEPAVIKGMKESLRTFRPRALIVEVKRYSFERAATEESALLELVESLGYHDQGIELNRNRLFRPAE